MGDRESLGDLLRVWRDRSAPAKTPGFSGKRRAKGMRREELADLAGLSVDYVVRLERGRAKHPSAQVIAALGSALRLSGDETSLLYRAAALTPPAVGIDRRVPPSIERLATRLDNLPVAVYSADWWLLRWNPLWASLLGDPAEAAGRDRNLVWQVFGSRGWRAAPADRPLTEFQRALVSDLRVLLVEHPADKELADLVEELRRKSPSFAELWAEGTAARHRSERKNVAHPDLGNLLLDCDVLQVPESNVHLLVYSAEPGSKDAARLELLSALRMSGAPVSTLARPHEQQARREPAAVQDESLPR